MRLPWIPAFDGMTDFDGNPVGWVEEVWHLEAGLGWIPAFAGMTWGANRKAYFIPIRENQTRLT